MYIDHRHRAWNREMFGDAVRRCVRQSGVRRHKRAVECGDRKGNQRQVERKSHRLHVSVQCIYL